jgi:Domain of unknown function (DUF4124)
VRAGTALALVVVAAAGVSAWWYVAPDTMPALVKQQLPVSAKSNPTLYRWKDAKGGLHVTDVPPTDRPYETLHYDPDTNVVPTVVPPKGAIR